MKPPANLNVYDIVTRKQLYLEGVKTLQAAKFNSVLHELKNEITVIMRNVKYSNLDALTKAELNKLIITLRTAQSHIYSKYYEDVFKQLRDFMEVDLKVSRIIFTSAFLFSLSNSEDMQPLTDSKATAFLKEQNKQNAIIPWLGIAAITDQSNKLWADIMHRPIPANGLFPEPFVKAFTVSAQGSIENIIRKAWANKMTIDETLIEILGDPNLPNNSSQLKRISIQESAVISTAFQHVSAIVSAAVASVLYSEYIWCSVIDSGTTDICLKRNLRRYIYGQGPLPPAHIRCRSHVTPASGSDDIPQESLYTWMRRQPDDVQDDFLGQDVAEQLRNGKIKSSDFVNYQKSSPLTFDEFRSKVNKMLNR